MEDGEVVDGQRAGVGFQPRVGGGVEDRTVVGGEAEFGVVDAAVDGVEEGDQPVPGGGGVLQGRHAFGVRAGLELGAQEAGGVGAGVHLVVGGEQAALLGEEEEDDAHHHGDGAPVDLARADAVGV
ncbi:hypothetical protein [Streptomyces sp. NPDC057910]|uniref:hypothetical protein n=1 Tax=Streptomyces sp. NPDC057910 TaxID=3346278 RepID=UPI0036EC467F